MSENRTRAGQLSFDHDLREHVVVGPTFLEWLASMPPHFDRDWPTPTWATRLTARYHADLDRNGLAAPPLTNAGTATHKDGGLP